MVSFGLDTIHTLIFKLVHVLSQNYKKQDKQWHNKYSWTYMEKTN